MLSLHVIIVIAVALYLFHLSKNTGITRKIRIFCFLVTLTGRFGL